MKLSRETYGLAFICLLFLGGLYLVTALAELPSFARLSDTPWLLPIVNVATVSIYFYNSVSRRVTSRKNPVSRAYSACCDLVCGLDRVCGRPRRSKRSAHMARKSVEGMLRMDDYSAAWRDPDYACREMAERGAAHVADDCRPVLRRCYHVFLHFGWTVTESDSLSFIPPAAPGIYDTSRRATMWLLRGSRLIPAGGQPASSVRCI